MSVSAWEALFMLVALKLPVVYLAAVVWWAVRAQPELPGGEDDVRTLSPLTPCGWDDWKSRRRVVRRGRLPRRPTGSRPRVRARAT